MIEHRTSINSFFRNISPREKKRLLSIDQKRVAWKVLFFLREGFSFVRMGKTSKKYIRFQNVLSKNDIRIDVLSKNTYEFETRPTASQPPSWPYSWRPIDPSRDRMPPTGASLEASRRQHASCSREVKGLNIEEPAGENQREGNEERCEPLQRG